MRLCLSKAAAVCAYLALCTIYVGALYVLSPNARARDDPVVMRRRIARTLGVCALAPLALMMAALWPNIRSAPLVFADWAFGAALAALAVSLGVALAVALYGLQWTPTLGGAGVGVSIYLDAVSVIMLVLGWTKIFEPSSIAGLRKYAFFGCCIAGGCCIAVALHRCDSNGRPGSGARAGG